MAESYQNNLPLLGDSMRILEAKILNVLNETGGGGGGGSGSGSVILVSGDPNGATTATRPALGYSLNGDLWIKTDAGASDTGWSQIIAAP